VLSAHRALVVPDELHHGLVDDIVETLLKVFVLIAWDAHIEMEVAVADMSIANS